MNTTVSNMSLSPSTMVQIGSSICTQKRFLSIRATRRILAPYVKARKKPTVEFVENKYFSFYVQKKPSILMRVMTKWCVATDLLAVLDETAMVLKETTRSAAVTVYMVDETLDEIHQVTDSYESKQHRISYKIEQGTNVAAHVAFTKNFVKIDDLLEDIRFPDGLGNSELTVKAVICVPVLTPEDDCLAVFELYREFEDNAYDDRDLRVIICMCTWVGAANYQNQQRVTLQKQQELNEYLLHLTECYFADAMLLDKLITEVVNFAKVALNAEHGLFYVLKPIINDDKIYVDFYEEGIGLNQDILYKKNMKVKLDDISDLVSFVARNGITVNIKNALTDSRVQQNKKGYQVRSVLCIAIKCVDQILGVMEIVNKINGSCFEKSDEILLQTFSDFCGFVLKYGKLYEKMNKLNSLNNVYSEMLSEHMKPCVHDILFLYNHPEMPSLPEHFHHFDFYISEAYELYLPQLTMYMFYKTSQDLFKNREELGKFVLCVQKSYKNLPFHNYHHAFNVCHCVYNILRRNRYFFTAMEIKSLIVASLCHDIDHYGKSNNFFAISGHTLAELYEESILENHHWHVASLIFKFLNLFSYMSVEEYKQFLIEVRLSIFATDLSTHITRRAKLNQICFENRFDCTNNNHRFLLKSTIMTMADLSEYYEEGDEEKALGVCPLPMMNRDKAEMVATDQIQFMSTIVLPCTMVIAKVLPNCEALYSGAMKLLESWKEIYDTQGQKLWTIEDSVPHKRIFV